MGPEGTGTKAGARLPLLESSLEVHVFVHVGCADAYICPVRNGNLCMSCRPSTFPSVPDNGACSFLVTGWHRSPDTRGARSEGTRDRAGMPLSAASRKEAHIWGKTHVLGLRKHRGVRITLNALHDAYQHIMCRRKWGKAAAGGGATFRPKAGRNDR